MCTSTINKFMIQVACMRTSLTLPTTSRGLSSNTTFFCTVKGTNLKNFSMKFWKRFCLNLFSQRAWKCLVDSKTSCFQVNLDLIISPLLHCYIQRWKLGYDKSELDLTFTWLATTQTLVLECWLFTLHSPHCSQERSSQKNELTCLHKFTWSTISSNH